jgi:hypothetical protein
MAFLLVLPLFLPALHATQAQYQSGKILSVEEKTNTRVLYYLVNTPVTKDETYYEISVQMKDEVFICRFTPRHAADIPPPEWIPGSAVQARVSEKHLLLRRPEGGIDLDLAIAKRRTVKDESSSPPAASPKN